MDQIQVITTFLRKLGFLSLVGLLVVILAGPVLAVLGVMLGFAVVGLLVSLPVRWLVGGRPPELDRVREVGKRFCGQVFGRWRRFGDQVLSQGHASLEKVRATGRFLAVVCREILCGAILGGMLGLIRGLDTVVPSLPFILGICLGAVVGAVVALVSRPWIRETAEVPW